MAMERIYGAQQPHIKVGIFEIRIPFVHVTVTIPELLQGCCNGMLCFGAMATIMQCFGCSEEAAYAAAWLNAALYIINQLSGEPTVCGWIMPAVPLVTMFCLSYPEGSRIQACTALELMLAVIFLVLGVTGLAKKVIAFVPAAIKGGVILGAALSSFFAEFKDGGRFSQFPIALYISCALMVYLLYSPRFQRNVKQGGGFIKWVGGMGIMPAVVLAAVIAYASGERPFSFQLFPLFALPNLKLMYTELSPFSIGFPSVSMFLSAIPTAIAVFIVAFGDGLILEGIVRDGCSTRPDEYVNFNLNRAYITTAIRNIVMGLLAPFPPLNSTLGAAFSIQLYQRYKTSDPQTYYSIHDGAVGANWGEGIFMLITPMVCIFKPIAGIAMGLCQISQGFTCTAVGIQTCRNKIDLCVAGTCAGIMVAKGAAWGLGAGIAAYILTMTLERIQEDLSHNKAEVEEELAKLRAADELARRNVGTEVLTR